MPEDYILTEAQDAALFALAGAYGGAVILDQDPRGITVRLAGEEPERQRGCWIDPHGRITRVCACGCPETFEVATASSRRRFASDACRARAWKAQARYADPRRSQPYRNGKPRKKSKPSVRISYRKAVDAIESAFTDGANARLGELTPRDRAEAILDPLLTPTARKALEAA